MFDYSRKPRGFQVELHDLSFSLIPLELDQRDALLAGEALDLLPKVVTDVWRRAPWTGSARPGAGSRK